MTAPLATESFVLASTVPEPGQLVEVRRRQWIVSDVDAAVVSPELSRRNLVKLASIDEDVLGEEIKILWELEPGAHVIERAGLPTLSALDDPSKLEAFLDAEDVDARIVRLREMHREIDAAVMRAYGWDDIDLGHGYHEQPNRAENDRVRFTISDGARAEMLRRIAELNRLRYEEEQSALPAAKPRASRGRAKAVPAGQGTLALIDVPAPTTKTSKTKAVAPAKKASKRSSR